MKTKMNLTQFVQTYTKEMLVIVIVVAIALIGLSSWSYYYGSTKVETTSCQELIEEAILKDQLIDAYRAKDKMTELAAEVAQSIITAQDQIIQTMERDIEALTERVKLLGV